MLQEAQRTSAPSAFRVSISTAVWMVMCSEPAMRAPFSGCFSPNSSRHGHQARHLGLGDRDLLAAQVGKADVLDDVVLCHRGLLVSLASVELAQLYQSAGRGNQDIKMSLMSRSSSRCRHGRAAGISIGKAQIKHRDHRHSRDDV